MSRRALASLALGLGLTGCATSEIVVATLDGGDEGRRCVTNADCPANAFCAMDSCTDDHGGCELRPDLCDDTVGPTCGCDGVNYWNDCLRRQAGVASSSIGECLDTAVGCSDSTAQGCPLGASCSRLLFGSNCSTSPPPGTCWMLPSACPDGGSTETWTSCADPTRCDDTCTAIRSGVPHQLADCP
jgi:hypothetical protein